MRDSIWWRDCLTCTAVAIAGLLLVGEVLPRARPLTAEGAVHCRAAGFGPHGPKLLLGDGGERQGGLHGGAQLGLQAVGGGEVDLVRRSGAGHFQEREDSHSKPLARVLPWEVVHEVRISVPVKSGVRQLGDWETVC